jgi:hypothetical protein
MDVTIILATGQAEAIAIDGERATIGRLGDCDIKIDSKSVSRLHAELLRTGPDTWEIHDLGSLNGLLIAGRHVDRAPLKEGDEVVIGDAKLVVGRALVSDSTIMVSPAHHGSPAGLWLDSDERCLRRDSEMVGERLAPREYMLLKLLVEAQGHVVERKRIEEAVWGADAYDDNALHQLVRRTREKIGDDAGAPRILLTLPGVGYRINASIDMPP